MLEGSKPMYYPGKKRADIPSFVHHIIDHVDIQARNVKILQVAGGKRHAYWATRFCRRKCQNGLFHVKIYVTRRKKFAVEIEEMKTVETTSILSLEEFRADVAVLEQGLSVFRHYRLTGHNGIAVQAWLHLSRSCPAAQPSSLLVIWTSKCSNN